MDEKTIIQVLKLLWDGHTPGQIQEIAKKRKDLKCSKSLARNIKIKHDLIVNFLSQGVSVERTAADNSIKWSIELIQIIQKHEDELASEQTVLQEKETIEESEFLALQNSVVAMEKKTRKEKKRKADIKDLWRRKAADPEGLIEIFSSAEIMLNYAKVWVASITLEEFKFFCEDRDLPLAETLFEIVGSLETFHGEGIWGNDDLFEYMSNEIYWYSDRYKKRERQALRDKKFQDLVFKSVCPSCGKIPIYQTNTKEVYGTVEEITIYVYSINPEDSSIFCMHCHERLFFSCPECKDMLIHEKDAFKCKKCEVFYKFTELDDSLYSGVKLPIEMPII